MANDKKQPWVKSQSAPTAQEQAANAKQAQAAASAQHPQSPPTTAAQNIALASAQPNQGIGPQAAIVSREYAEKRQPELENALIVAAAKQQIKQHVPAEVLPPAVPARVVLAGDVLHPPVRVGDKVKCPECKGEGAIYGTASGRVVLCGLCKGARVATVMA